MNLIRSVLPAKTSSDSALMSFLLMHILTIAIGIHMNLYDREVSGRFAPDSHAKSLHNAEKHDKPMLTGGKLERSQGKTWSRVNRH